MRFCGQMPTNDDTKIAHDAASLLRPPVPPSWQKPTVGCKMLMQLLKEMEGGDGISGKID